MVVDKISRKEMFGWLDEYIENVHYDWFDGSDETFEILYNDGTTDYINEDYDGHKVRRINIASIVENNPESSLVFGNYEINEYGVVTTAYEMNIDENIIEVA